MMKPKVAIAAALRMAALLMLSAIGGLTVPTPTRGTHRSAATTRIA